jgi:hypothetical protein
LWRDPLVDITRPGREALVAVGRVGIHAIGHHGPGVRTVAVRRRQEVRVGPRGIVTVRPGQVWWHSAHGVGGYLHRGIMARIRIRTPTSRCSALGGRVKCRQLPGTPGDVGIQNALRISGGLVLIMAALNTIFGRVQPALAKPGGVAQHRYGSLVVEKATIVPDDARRPGTGRLRRFGRRIREKRCGICRMERNEKPTLHSGYSTRFGMWRAGRSREKSSKPYVILPWDAKITTGQQTPQRWRENKRPALTTHTVKGGQRTPMPSKPRSSPLACKAPRWQKRRRATSI